MQLCDLKKSVFTHKNNILKCLLLGKNKTNESSNQCQKR